VSTPPDQFDEPQPPPPPGKFAIGPYKSAKRAREHGLVILAMRLTYDLIEGESGGYYLWVDEAEREAIYEQLEKYQKESKNWPPRPLAALPSDRPTAPLTLLGYAAILTGFHAAQYKWPSLTDAGASNNLRIFEDGQWELPMTALTLHADVGHLLGNMLAGVCFGFLLNRILGAGLAWILFLLAGYFGNCLNAWFYWPEYHGSIGASTATFGALGLLVGQSMALKFSPSAMPGWQHRAVPLLAGIVILLWTGFGSHNVDVLAHVFGFAAGIPLGAVGFLISEKWPEFSKNNALLIAPPLLIAGAWAIALAQ